MPMCPILATHKIYGGKNIVEKLERFGAKSTPLLLDELKKNLHTLETSIGPIPESYRAYLLHFGVSALLM